jgi:hypothetical protein
MTLYKVGRTLRIGVSIPIENASGEESEIFVTGPEKRCGNCRFWDSDPKENKEVYGKHFSGYGVCLAIPELSEAEGVAFVRVDSVPNTDAELWTQQDFSCARHEEKLPCSQCGALVQAYSATTSDGAGLCHDCIPFGVFMEMVR